MCFRLDPFSVALLAAGMLAGCRPPGHPDDLPPAPKLTLPEARSGFKTKLLRRETAGLPVDPPPAGIFRLVHYPAEPGDLAAYLSPAPRDGQRHPLVIWLVGGFSSSISDMAWHPGPPENDQSGSAFRQAGLLMMYPSLRGGNENPGVLERFYGEVDDVVAAAEYAAKQDYVDPERIYLGGHSTGGTLALLVAESHSRFRAVFAFGPVDDVLGYGSRMLPFDTTDPREAELRSPLPWLSGIQIPTFVFEGTQKSNVHSLRLLAQAPHPAQVTFYELRGATHFSTLAPITRLIAAKIGQDTGTKPNLRFTEEELALALRHSRTE